MANVVHDFGSERVNVFMSFSSERVNVLSSSERPIVQL